MHAIEIKNLNKTYDNGFVALKDISFSIAEGDFFALLGPNGAGKSTTLGILCGLVRKTSGQVRVMGRDLDQDPQAVRRLLGVVPQEFNFNQFEKVDDIIYNQAGYYGLSRRQVRPQLETLLKALDLWDKRDSQARQLSGGMKRRLMIARALIHQPKLIILDEPTAGVDIEIRRSMWQFMRELNQQGTSIILTTHYLEEAENLCPNLAIIQKGEIIANTSTKALLSQMEQTTFVLDSFATLDHLPMLPEVQLQALSATSFSLQLPKGADLAQVMASLQQHGIRVQSIRPQSNRLEELFMQLVQQPKAQQPKAKAVTGQSTGSRPTSEV